MKKEVQVCTPRSYCPLCGEDILGRSLCLSRAACRDLIARLLVALGAKSLDDLAPQDVRAIEAVLRRL